MLRITRTPDGFYVVAALLPGGRVVKRIFGLGRADQHAYARFVEAMRSDQNNKPYRPKALKEEARRTAYRADDGTFRSDTGTLVGHERRRRHDD